MIILLFFFIILAIILDYFIDKFWKKSKKQHHETIILTDDIAKQLINQAYNNFNHYSNLYIAHIAIFITLYTIAIGYYTDDFNVNIIQYGMSKHTTYLPTHILSDDIKFIYSNDDFRILTTVIFMAVSLYFYLSMMQSFILLANNRELINLLEYKLKLPYNYMSERGYYALSWSYIKVYKIINIIILLFMIGILMYAFMNLYSSLTERIIIFAIMIKLFMILHSTTKTKY